MVEDFYWLRSLDLSAILMFISDLLRRPPGALLRYPPIFFYDFGGRTLERLAEFYAMPGLIDSEDFTF